MCSSPPRRLRLTSGGDGDEAERKQGSPAKQDKQAKSRQQLASKGGSGSDQDDARGRRRQQQRDGERQPRGRGGLAAAAALGTVAVYASVRGGISAFHHARRHFLTQLLHDLSAALTGMGATWWLDFGSLLGVYRDGQLILHDNDIDVAVWRPDWPALAAALKAALPQYSSRIVTPSDDPDARFIRVYCPLGMADVFGATPVGEPKGIQAASSGTLTSSSSVLSQSALASSSVLTANGSSAALLTNGSAEASSGDLANGGSAAAAQGAAESDAGGEQHGGGQAAAAAAAANGKLANGGKFGGRVLVDCGHGSCTEIDADVVLPTGVLQWRGTPLSVPGDLEGALEQRYGPGWRVPRYMDKGADVVEGQKLYARAFRALSTLGIRI